MDSINVLSLCDGMSCGQIALNELNIPINNYYAAEIKPCAIKVTQFNYPNTIQIGDVNKISYKDGILFTEKGEFEVGKIDLMMWGSPCQTFSIATVKNQRTGLENKEKSGLFYECYRIWQEIKPKYFLFENVASMKKEDKDLLSSILNIQPIKINSSIVAPALRNRLYWTDIPIIGELEKKDIKLQDILTSGYTNREKARCLTVRGEEQNRTPVKAYHRYAGVGFDTLIFKSKEHFEQCKNYYDIHYKGRAAKDIPVGETDIFDGVRYMNKTEREKCQTVPSGYTSCLTEEEAKNVLGDGWTIEVIKFLLKGIKYNL